MSDHLRIEDPVTREGLEHLTSCDECAVTILRPIALSALRMILGMQERQEERARKRRWWRRRKEADVTPR